MKTAKLLLAFSAASTILAGQAQAQAPTGDPPPRVTNNTTPTNPNNPNGVTNASSADFSVQYGGNTNYPSSYRTNRAFNNPYVLSPYIVAPVTIPRPAVPAVAPFSDLEYGQLVQTSLEAGAVESAGATATTASIVLQAESEANGLPPGVSQAKVVDVLDRGTLVLDTFEEVRLRGVNMPSVDDRDEEIRYYARTGADAIRRLTRDKPVYVKLGEPQRDSNGMLLGDVFLEDASLLNRKVLELGYGRFDAKDYLPGEFSVTLQAAELRAREAKLGVFSAR